jgi:hypothetical protein
MAGTTNSSTIARLTARPASDSAPRRAGEHQHHDHEHRRQQEHRAAALEIVEAVARASHGRGARPRLRRLGHPDVVARVQVRVERAGGAELDVDLLAGLRSALQTHGRVLALLLGEASADHLVDPLHLRLVAVDDCSLGERALDVARPKQHQADERCASERRREYGEEAGHAPKLAIGHGAITPHARVPLLGVDPLHVDRLGAEVGVAELALDDVERNALTGELERMRVEQRKPAPDPGMGGEPAEPGANGSA